MTTTPLTPPPADGIPAGGMPADAHGPRAPSAVALAMAEALSLAVRGVDRATAVRQLRAGGRDVSLLLAAAERCRGFDEVDEPVVRRAARWLEAAARRPRAVRERPAAGNLRDAGPCSG